MGGRCVIYSEIRYPNRCECTCCSQNSHAQFSTIMSLTTFFSLLLITQCILIFSDLIRLLEYPKPFLAPLRLSEPVVQTFDALIISSCQMTYRPALKSTRLPQRYSIPRFSTLNIVSDYLCLDRSAGPHHSLQCHYSQKHYTPLFTVLHEHIIDGAHAQAILLFESSFLTHFGLLEALRS